MGTEAQMNSDEGVNNQPLEGEDAGSALLANPDEAFYQRIRDEVKKLEEIDAQRKDLTASKTAIFSGLCADAGVNKKAMAAAMSYVELKDKNKLNWDLTYQVVREALGEPVQPDLFEAKLQKSVEQHQQTKKANVTRLNH